MDVKLRSGGVTDVIGLKQSDGGGSWLVSDGGGSWLVSDGGGSWLVSDGGGF